MERKTSNDWVKDEPKKMLPERGSNWELVLSQSNPAASLPMGVRRPMRFGEIDAEFLSSRHDLGHPGHRLTRGSVSFA